jgi:hypothetical protein
MKISISKINEEREALIKENEALTIKLIAAQKSHLRDQREHMRYLDGMINSLASHTDLELLFSLSMISKN